MTDTIRFLLMGNGSYTNRGCEAIVRGTTEIFRNQINNCSFFSCYFPDNGCIDQENEIDRDITHLPILSFPKRMSVNWFLSKINKKFVSPPIFQDLSLHGCSKYVKSSDAIIMIGGDNYTLDYNYPTRHFEILEYVIRHSKKVFFLGASIGPFSKDKEFEKYAVSVLKKVNKIYVRESLTFEYLNYLGLEKNLFLSADPAFCMKPTSVELTSEMGRKINNGCIGINLSPLLLRYQNNGDITRWTIIAANMVRSLVDNINLPILLIPHVTAGSGVMGLRDDYLFMKEVLKTIDRPIEQVQLLEPKYSASQLKWIISKMMVFAGARTHATIAALSSCIPTICLGYSTKAKGVVKDIYGDYEWLIKSDDLSLEIFQEKMKALVMNASIVKKHLDNVIPSFKERAMSSAMDICSFLSQQ